MARVLNLLAVAGGLAIAMYWLSAGDPGSRLAVVTDVAPQGQARLGPAGGGDSPRQASEVATASAAIAPARQDVSARGAGSAVRPIRGDATGGKAGDAEPQRGSQSISTASAARGGPPKVVEAPPALAQPKLQSMSSTELTLALQRELRRVGCYQGEINGEWTQSTRRAMDALVDRVNASLPIDKPDGVLLALVQNQKSMVCGNACPGGQVITQGGRCIPQSVAARSSSSVKAAEGVQTTRSASVTKNDWSVVATRDVPVPSPAPAPLPGRMAIGAPVAADDLTASVAGAPPAVIVYEHVPQRAEPTATVYPPPARRAQSSGGASKGMPSWAARAFAY